MERELAWSRGKPEEPFLLSAYADAQYAMGKRKLARETYQQEAGPADRLGMKQWLGFIPASDAIHESGFADCGAARESVAKSLSLVPRETIASCLLKRLRSVGTQPVLTD